MIVDVKELDIYNITGPVGVREAMKGCRLSFNQAEKVDSSDHEFGEKDLRLAKSLYKKGNDHSAFLRMIWFWIDINAPLSFWMQFEKYKYIHMLDMDIESRSESTMHTLLKKPLKVNDFTPDTSRSLVAMINYYIKRGDFDMALNTLPKGFKQRRMVNVNMASLLAIDRQRQNHRLKSWNIFLKEIRNRVPYIQIFNDMV